MTETKTTWTALDLAKRIAELADEKQARKIRILRVTDALQVTDYFVICEGKNRRHLKVVGEDVAKHLKQDGLYRIGGSRLDDGMWVLLDFGPVVLHVMSEEGRAYYDLDNLWGDCEAVEWRSPERIAQDEAEEAAAAERDEEQVRDDEFEDLVDDLPEFGAVPLADLQRGVAVLESAEPTRFEPLPDDEGEASDHTDTARSEEE